ncbi:hypothetical protein C8Q75DRAFT_522637 [Abortiporus biennis]|nr:hypothetical protein C8Q75DRAFT_522637 [Abortiporus biennis]
MPDGRSYSPPYTSRTHHRDSQSPYSHHHSQRHSQYRDSPSPPRHGESSSSYMHNADPSLQNGPVRGKPLIFAAMASAPPEATEVETIMSEGSMRESVTMEEVMNHGRKHTRPYVSPELPEIPSEVAEPERKKDITPPPAPLAQDEAEAPRRRRKLSKPNKHPPRVADTITTVPPVAGPSKAAVVPKEPLPLPSPPPPPLPAKSPRHQEALKPNYNVPPVPPQDLGLALGPPFEPSPDPQKLVNGDVNGYRRSVSGEPGKTSRRTKDGVKVLTEKQKEKLNQRAMNAATNGSSVSGSGSSNGATASGTAHLDITPTKTPSASPRKLVRPLPPSAQPTPSVQPTPAVQPAQPTTPSAQTKKLPYAPPAPPSPEDYAKSRSQRRGERLEKSRPLESSNVNSSSQGNHDHDHHHRHSEYDHEDHHHRHHHHHEHDSDSPEEPAEEYVPKYYPLVLHACDATLLANTVCYLSFYEWTVLTSVSREIRDTMFKRRDLSEIVLERYLHTVGYERWKWKGREPLVLSLDVSTFTSYS